MGYETIEQQYQQDPKRLVTREEAAAILRLKPETLAKWACMGKEGLPVVKIGSRVRYQLDDIQKFISENRQ